MLVPWRAHTFVWLGRLGLTTLWARNGQKSRDRWMLSHSADESFCVVKCGSDPALILLGSSIA